MDVANNNEDEEPNIVSRIAWNDPELTRLELHNITDVLELDPNRIHGNQDVIDPAHIEDRLNRTIAALKTNHTIKSVFLSAYFGYSANYQSFFELLDALIRLENVEELELEHNSYFRGRELTSSLSDAKKLKVLKLSSLHLEVEEDLAFAQCLRNHPCLEVVHMLNFEFMGKLVKKREARFCSDFLNTILTVPTLKELQVWGLTVGKPAVCAKLVQMPNLLRLTMKEAGLGDNHILAMVDVLMQENGKRFYLDVSGEPCKPSLRTTSKHLFSQDGWDALFRLVEHNSLIRVQATARLDPPNCRRRFFKFTYSFLLNDQDAVKHVLEKHEENRRLRMKEAGFEDALTNEIADDTEWAEVMGTVSEDSIALFHILRANPTICDISRSASTRRKRKRSEL